MFSCSLNGIYPQERSGCSLLDIAGSRDKCRLWNEINLPSTPLLLSSAIVDELLKLSETNFLWKTVNSIYLKALRQNQNKKPLPDKIPNIFQWLCVFNTIPLDNLKYAQWFGLEDTWAKPQPPR